MQVTYLNALLNKNTLRWNIWKQHIVLSVCLRWHDERQWLIFQNIVVKYCHKHTIIDNRNDGIVLFLFHFKLIYTFWVQYLFRYSFSWWPICLVYLSILNMLLDGTVFVRSSFCFLAAGCVGVLMDRFIYKDTIRL